MTTTPVLSLKNAVIRYDRLTAVDGVSLDLYSGETLVWSGKADAENLPSPGQSSGFSHLPQERFPSPEKRLPM
ncbi:hypothetical protein [Rhizobium sp. ZX09]|uniref:hypothetical protein n=1 Tax=Rhizobium sp. ZX09 TaxID=2291939 RepID=UPI001FEF89DF|nr:hypothetical protein [Rhizobium sp. ZX09]